MRTFLWFLSVTVLSALTTGCGGSSNTCNITANVTPVTAIADHNVGPPGNQVQFSATSTVNGNCSLRPDILGSWSTSDPANTSISTSGLATCLGATTTPATISNSGMVRGTLAFTPATLTCR